MSDSDEAYDAPRLFSFVARLVTRPRTGYSLDVARYVTSGYSSEATDYQAGLVFLACIVGGFAFLWFFVIFTLKLKGKEVGCASGRAFERTEPAMDHADSTDLESNQSTSQNGRTRGQPISRRQEADNCEAEDLSMHSSLPSAESELENDSCSTDESVFARPSRRERRTQVCFLIFGVVALVCVPMILAFSFAPLRKTSHESIEYREMAHNIVVQAQTSTAAVSLASNASLDIATRLATNFSEACPNASSNQTLQGVLNMVMLFSDKFEAVNQGLTRNLSDVQDVLDDTEAVLNSVDVYYAQTNRYLWLVPCLLLLFSAFVLAAIFGVIIAWRNESSHKWQRWLTYGILPTLILYSISCWAMATTLGVVSAMGSDSCLYGSLQDGSPSNMIDSLLLYAEVSPNSTIDTFVHAYTSNCVAGEPTFFLQSMRNEVDSVISDIGSELSQIESIGGDAFAQMCGSDGVKDIFRGSSDLGKLLTVVSTALANSIDSLSCNNVHPIYTHLVEESMCTDATGAAASAFLLFLLLGVSTTGMITLRAAWTQPIAEQKILKEEDVAENMIVDEHEEYLAYISKYKHEWQEYRGFDSTLPCDPGPDFIDDGEGSLSEGSTADRSGDIMPLAGAREAFDPYVGWDTRSVSTTGDISFPSLRSHTDVQGKSSTRMSSLLAPGLSTETREQFSMEAPSNDSLIGLGAALSGYSLQPAVDTLVSTKKGSDCTDISTSDADGESTSHHTSPQASRQAKREFFFPSSPKQETANTPQPETHNVAPEKLRDSHVTKSERILMEMDEIGGGGSPMSSRMRPKTERTTPTSAVTKMNQRNSPVATRQYEYGKSVRPAYSSPRTRQQSSQGKVMGRPVLKDDCSPSSYLQAPPRIDQYPKAYEPANGADEAISPQSTAFSACSSASADPDWSQFLRSKP